MKSKFKECFKFLIKTIKRIIDTWFDFVTIAVLIGITTAIFILILFLIFDPQTVLNGFTRDWKNIVIGICVLAYWVIQGWFILKRYLKKRQTK